MCAILRQQENPVKRLRLDTTNLFKQLQDAWEQERHAFIYILNKDARWSYGKIANRFGCTSSRIGQIIKKLEEEEKNA